MVAVVVRIGIEDAIGVVALDVGEIETIFIQEEDKIPNALGVKGIGEVAIVGVAAAIANAIFNATGKRVRSLPITPDKVL